MNYSSKNLDQLFSERIKKVPRSFIREILKVAISPDVISFAGGLPNRELFPVEELAICADRILKKAGRDILQYSNSEGYIGLREQIAARYKLKGLDVSPENILITTGSQQALDLLGKTFINEGDEVIIEEPGYLGAIQAFGMFRSNFQTVPLLNDGPDLEIFETKIQKGNPKFAYLIPNFQNPSGISYSEEKREAIAQMINGRDLYLVEDDPYGDLRYAGVACKSFYHYLPEKTILLGTFSKTVVPSFRIGWVVAPPQVMEKLITAKQASDLHTDYFAQRLIHEYLASYSIDEHIAKISEVYGRQAEAMINSLEECFPATCKFTRPQGGMFLWVSLPEGTSSMQLFERAVEQKVAFVPGVPFYVGYKDVNTLRLNFSCSDEKTIHEGINRLAQVLEI